MKPQELGLILIILGVVFVSAPIVGIVPLSMVGFETPGGYEISLRDVAPAGAASIFVGLVLIVVGAGIATKK